MLRVAIIAILIIAAGKLPAQVAFQKAYWADGSSGHIRDVIALNAGGYLATGNYENGIGLFKLNGVGDTVLVRKYSTIFSSFGYRLLEMSDGRVAVCGSIGVVDGGPGIMMLDSNLNVLWTSVASAIVPNTIEGIAETYDGGTILVGTAEAFGANIGERDLVVVRHDSQGDTLWSTVLGRESIHELGAGIVQLPDSGFLVAGAGTGTVSDAILARLDAMGDTVFVKRYGPSADVNGIRVTALVTSPDGGYLAAGQASLVFPGSIDLALLKLDSALNISWLRTYDLGDHEYVNDVTYTQSGDICVVGRDGADDSGIMARISGQGDMKWAFGLTYQDIDLLTIAPTPDDGAMIGGAVFFSVDSSGWYAARIDSLGHIGCFDVRDSLSWTSASVSIGLEHGLEVIRGLNVQAFAVNEAQADVNVVELCDTCFSAPTANLHQTSFLLDAAFMDVSEGSTSRTWIFPGGDTSNAVVAHYSFPAAGTYEVCLIARNDCGADTICDSVTVACSQPVAGFDWETDTMTVAFLDQSDYATAWSWDFGDTNSDTGPFPVHTYAEKGDYWVCLDASNYCGNSQQCDSVSVNPVGIVVTDVAPTLEVWPIPTSGVVNFELRARGQRSVVHIYDLTGRLHDQFQVESGKGASIELEPGVYLYRTTIAGAGYSTGRIVVL